MGTLVEDAFRLCHLCLFERDLEAAKKIPPLDNQIDQFYRQIELECAKLMASHQPTDPQDMRILSAFMQLVRDLERIGDYAEDLAEMSIKLFAYPPDPCLPRVKEMSLQAQFMLATSLMGLAELDANAGMIVKEMDDVVDEAYHFLYNTLAHQRNPGIVEPILLLGLAIRHLERMADHATNVAQRVSYIVTGHRN